jgi:hypothetical protein
MQIKFNIFISGNNFSYVTEVTLKYLSYSIESKLEQCFILFYTVL